MTCHAARARHQCACLFKARQFARDNGAGGRVRKPTTYSSTTLPIAVTGGWPFISLNSQVRDSSRSTTSPATNVDITFHSRYFADPWWGRGEAISLTAIPRNPSTTPGSLHHVTLANVTGTAENSVRICGSPQSRVQDVLLDRISVTLERTTSYPGGLFDNRPTTAQQAIEPHDTPGFSIEHADNVTLRNCTVKWGARVPESFTYAVETRDATGVKIEGLSGGPARKELGKATSNS